MSANQLPVVKDRELEKRRPDAKSHSEKCESERKELADKEKNDADSKKKEFADKPLGGKMANFKAVCASIKSVAKERKSKSAANIKKGKELFEYPMKPSPDLGASPDIPVK